MRYLSQQQRLHLQLALAVAVCCITRYRRSANCTPMAQTNSCWSATTMKLILLAMAIAAVSGAALAEEEAPQGRGRFLANFDEQTPISARRHLNQFGGINLCGSGTSDQCEKKFGKFWKCCKDRFGNSACYNTGILWDKCGSCTNKCAFGQICCNGVCSNLQSDPKNCGKCGRECKGVPCIRSTCGYNGKD